MLKIIIEGKTYYTKLTPTIDTNNVAVGLIKATQGRPFTRHSDNKDLWYVGGGKSEWTLPEDGLIVGDVDEAPQTGGQSRQSRQ